MTAAGAGSQERNGRRARFLRELKERAVRLVREHRDDYPSEWAAISSIAGKLGASPETVRHWVRRAQVDAGLRPGTATEERERMRQLEQEQENRELRRANEILKAASVFFARELDPQLPGLPGLPGRAAREKR